MADFGGGLVGPSNGSASLTLTDTVVRNNHAGFAGGGFVLFRGALEGAEISGNGAPYGGGGAVFYWDVSADADTVIRDNEASDAGGGLFVWDEGQLTLTGTTFERNTAASSGGAVFLDDGSVTGTSCDLASGADDNAPDDVAVQARSGVTSYTAGAGATFSCTSASGACSGL
jgi:predicted outer membrane repeat protein